MLGIFSVSEYLCTPVDRRKCHRSSFLGSLTACRKLFRQAEAAGKCPPLYLCQILFINFLTFAAAATGVILIEQRSDELVEESSDFSEEA